MDNPGGLTHQQQKLLTFIREYIAEHDGVSPSYTEMLPAVGLRSKSNIARLIYALERKGYIKRDPWCSRGVMLCEPDTDHEAHAQRLKEAETLLRDVSAQAYMANDLAVRVRDFIRRYDD